MKLEEFISNFADQFDDTDVSEIQSETIYQDLDEWSSLAALGVIAFVKTQYDKEITGKEIRFCETVKDLFDCVNSK